VAVLNGMLEHRWLAPIGDNAFEVTESGARALTTLGLDGADWQRRAAVGHKGVAYGCLDWSERRDHLAGKLASALLEHFIAQHWLRRKSGERALHLTPSGQRALGAWLPAAALATAD
jgi:hypothetical protein